MHLTVLGATGGLGRHVVRLALADGHRVTAHARTPDKLALSSDALTVVQGDLADRASIDRAVAGAEAVISCIGYAKGQDPAVYGEGMGHVVEAMGAHGVRRLVAISGAGLELEGDERGLGRRLVILALKTFAGKVLAGKQREWEVIRHAPVDWTLVRVARMVEREPAGRVAVGLHAVPGSPMVSYADVARWMIDQTGEVAFVGKAPFLSGP